MVAKIPGQRLNCYLFVVYRSPSTDDRVFDCLCEAMRSIQSVDPKSVFCFVCDFNRHQSEWLGSGITDAHGVAAFDFATVANCSQLVNGPTHRAGGVLDLVLTNVPDLCDVHVHGNAGRLDHASLLFALNFLPTVAGFDVARRVPSSPELIGMPFVRLCLDLTGKVFSGVQPWFRILMGKLVELWSDSFQWLL